MIEIGKNVTTAVKIGFKQKCGTPVVAEMTAEQQFGEDWCVDQTHGPPAAALLVVDLEVRDAGGPLHRRLLLQLGGQPGPAIDFFFFPHPSPKKRMTIRRDFQSITGVIIKTDGDGKSCDKKKNLV